MPLGRFDCQRRPKEGQRRPRCLRETLKLYESLVITSFCAEGYVVRKSWGVVPPGLCSIIVLKSFNWSCVSRSASFCGSPKHRRWACTQWPTWQGTPNNASEACRSPTYWGRRVTTHHLAKVLQWLGKVGLTDSATGRYGGFRLAKPADELTLLEICEAIEGPLSEPGCLLGRSVCDMKGCLLSELIQSIGQQLEEFLTRTTLAELANRAGVLK